MFHITHPRLPIRIIAPSATRTTSVTAPHADARSTRAESLAAPLALGAVVVATLVLAVAAALFTALGA